MTDVANWDDPPATFELYGPFTVGSAGVTRVPGQESLHWEIRSVNPIESYAIEMALDRAVISFEWRFERLGDKLTQLTQHIALAGDNALAYLAHIQSMYTANLAAGMARIAAAMERSQATAGH